MANAERQSRQKRNRQIHNRRSPEINLEVAATPREDNWREADFINIYDRVNSFPLDGLGSGKRPVYVRF